MNIVAGRPSVSVGEQRIEWCPIAAPEHLMFTGTSYHQVCAALVEAFGSMPIRLTKKDLPTLNGMCAAAGDGAQPYKQLWGAVTQFGEIEVR